MRYSILNSLHQSWWPGKVSGFILLLFASSANATTIGGVDFPQGAISFADAVVSYNPDAGGAVPSAANSEPSNALGLPEVPGNTSIGACSGDPYACPFVSLGDGGSITLKFTDNLLTGSGDSSLDLWVFEVGPDVEDTFVDISKDGNTWFSVGKVFGTTSGIDIDAFGFSQTDSFGYVRLTDDPNEGSTTGASVGADIDAIGAISTVPSVPVPPAIWLFGSGLMGLLGFVRRNA
jgi:hypothetical protein